MIKRKFIIYIVIVLFLGLVTFSAFRGAHNADTYLTFTFQDAVSKGWIWNAKLTLQNRTLNTYYQSDRGVKEYTFTNLNSGNWVIEISAPGYESASVPVTIKKGRNILEEPIELTGTGIQNLSYFVPFEQISGGDINVEIRPVGMDGQAVINHPCMDLWISARITIQMKDDLIAQESSISGAIRGPEVFRGTLDWEWDSLPETTFRYSAIIPGNKISVSNAPFHVIDYLFVVPIGNSTSSDKIEEIVSQAWKGENPDNLTKILDDYRDRLNYYAYTSWNVEGLQ